MKQRSRLEVVSAKFPTDITNGDSIPVSLHLRAIHIVKPVTSLTFLLKYGDNNELQRIKVSLDKPLLKNGDESEQSFKIDFNKIRFGGCFYSLTLDMSELTLSGNTTTLGMVRFTETPREKLDVKIARRNGYTTIIENGKPIFWNGFQGLTDRSNPTVTELQQRGVTLVNLQKLSDSYCMGSIFLGWQGIGKYDFAGIEEVLSFYTAINPKVKILFQIGIDAPEWWARQHPDELVKYYGETKPEGLNSPASMKLREDSGRMLREVIGYLEKSRFAGNIIGYRLTSHCDGGEFQYLGGHINKIADYSTAMQSYFRNFLREKYHNDAAVLRNAWHKPDITFETAELPDERQRRGSEFGQMFRDPARAQNVIDYIECHNLCMADWAIHSLKIARETATGKLIGCYGGYVLCYNGAPLLNNAHLEFQRIFDSGYVDFISTPQDYDLRRSGRADANQVPHSSLRARNIKLLNEEDTRTYTSYWTNLTHAHNLDEEIGILKRDFVFNLCNDGGLYYYDMADRWFTSPALKDKIFEANQIGNAAQEFSATFPSQTAVLFSTESCYYLSLDNIELTNISSMQLRENLGRSGAPYDVWLLNDILRDDFPAAQYRFVAIVNGFALTEAQRTAIEKKLKKNHTTIYWGFAPGIFYNGGISSTAMTDLTGFRFEFDPSQASAFQMKVKDGLIGSATSASPKIRIAGADNVLGRFVSDNGIAFAMRQFKDWNSICSLVPQLDPEILRELQRNAGVHIFINTTDPIYYNGRFLGIHAVSNGVKHIKLPCKSNVYDVYRMGKLSDMTDSIDINMRNFETNLFFLGTDHEWQAFLKLKNIQR